MFKVRWISSRELNSKGPKEQTMDSSCNTSYDDEPSLKVSIPIACASEACSKNRPNSTVHKLFKCLVLISY